jgi:hypothetical protein
MWEGCIKSTGFFFKFVERLFFNWNFHLFSFPCFLQLFEEADAEFCSVFGVHCVAVVDGDGTVGWMKPF